MVVFEDNAFSPASLLIRELMGNTCDFSWRNEMLPAVINKHLAMNESVVCYIDYIIDNPNTLDLYDSLCVMYSENINVTILPIPCIEYVLLRLFIDLDIIKNTRELDLFKKSITGTSIDYDARYYEGFCKGVLNGNRLCLMNKNSKKNKVVSWYKGSCECIDPYGSSCRKLSMSQKVLALAYELPYFESPINLSYYIDRGLLKVRSVEEAKSLCFRWIKTTEDSLRDRINRLRAEGKLL